MPQISFWRIRPAAVASIAMALFSRTADGQVMVIANGASCPSCRIAVQPVAVLGNTDGPGMIEVGARGCRVDSRGRYWVLDGTEPMVFDSAGRFLRRLGRRGSGPGEYMRTVDAVPLPGDPVLVVDVELRRATVVSPELTVARSFALGVSFFSLVPLDWPRSAVINAEVRTAKGSGWPLHQVLLQEDFEIAQSFGPGDGDVRPYEFHRVSQVLAGRSDESSFWSADQLADRVSLWSKTGSLIKQLSRRPEWFPQPSSSSLGGPDTPPQPAISALSEDDGGRLWVFARVPSPTWREAWPKPPEGQREFEYKSMSIERMFRTRIEVLDFAVGRLVAETSIDDWVIAALPGQRIAAYGADSNGIPKITVYKLTLTGR